MAGIDQAYRSPIFLSRLAIGGVAAVGLCELAALAIGVVQVISPETRFESTGTSFWLFLQSLVALIQVPVYIFSVVMFLVWLFRAYANLPSIRSENSEYTPGWAIGWWFIPLANLIKPFQVVRNVWAESDPDVDVGGGFLSSVQSGAPAFMAIWWLFWILSNISANISGRLFDAQDAKNVEVAGYVFIISGILWCVASSLAIKVILSITERQQERFAKVGTLSQFSPPPPPPAFDRPE